MGAGGSPWAFDRAVRRVERLDGLLADYATNVVGLPLRRADDPYGVTWSIGGERMVRLEIVADGPDRLLVHELALLAPVRRALRTRHLTITYTPPA
jgi:hypothetical protein